MITLSIGLLILDICWTERASSLIPETFEPEDLGETAISFSLLFLVSTLVDTMIHQLAENYVNQPTLGIIK